LTEIWVLFGEFILGIAIWLRVRRWDGWGEAILQYEDVSDGLPDLGIRDIRSAECQITQAESRRLAH
jgi:hypothetical protein